MLWHQKTRPLICRLLSACNCQQEKEKKKLNKLHWSLRISKTGGAVSSYLKSVFIPPALGVFIYLTEKYASGCLLSGRHVKTHSETSSVRAVNTSLDSTVAYTVCTLIVLCVNVNSEQPMQCHAFCISFPSCKLLYIDSVLPLTNWPRSSIMWIAPIIL